MAVIAGTYMAMEKMSLRNGGFGGLIINTASVAGIVFNDGEFDFDSYFAAKHGVVALTRSLGVSISCIMYRRFQSNVIIFIG